MDDENKSPVFDYRTLRFLVGIIAFSLPFVVNFISSEPLGSISASYYTEAHDVFVGLLFIVGAFLLAYNGHFFREAVASKIAGILAILVALVPTTENGSTADFNSTLHYTLGFMLFSILAYLCFGPFRSRIKGESGKKGLRSKIYVVCGTIMILCMLAVLVGKLTLSDSLYDRLTITFWAEAIGLNAFGIAWMVAGKCIPFTTDDEDVAISLIDLNY